LDFHYAFGKLLQCRKKLKMIKIFYMDFVALGYDPLDVKKYISAGTDDQPPEEDQILAARMALMNDIYRNQSYLHEVCF